MLRRCEIHMQIPGGDYSILINVVNGYMEKVLFIISSIYDACQA
jgi:hypothetical protein